MQGLVHIVDDNASFRTATERRLKKAGYAVATYASAQPLLDRLLERLNERLGGEGLCKKCDAPEASATSRTAGSLFAVM